MASANKVLTIQSGAAVSQALNRDDIGDAGSYALVGIGCPGTIDAVTLAVQFSFDGSTWLAVTGSDGTAKTITQVASKYMALSPSDYACIPKWVRLASSGNVAALRDYTLVFRAV